MEVSI